MNFIFMFIFNDALNAIIYPTWANLGIFYKVLLTITQFYFDAKTKEGMVLALVF